jgi:hypothetical protein
MSDRIRLLSRPFPVQLAGQLASDSLFRRLAGNSIEDVALAPIGGGPALSDTTDAEKA